jgi:hypothetical protein
VTKDQLLNTDLVREDLLERGLVRLIDESKASEGERRAQDRAKNRGIGVWAQPTPSSVPTAPNTSSAPSGQRDSTAERLVIWASNNSIIRWILGSVISVGTIYAIVRQIYRSRRVMVFFGGDKYAGKTLPASGAMGRASLRCCAGRNIEGN